MEANQPLHIVVCLKSVLDPEAVNSYALWGRLEVDATGTAFRSSQIRRILNGYDEQAIEAAVRLREAGADCRITALTVGDEETVAVVRRAIAMGADDCIHIDDPKSGDSDGFRTAQLISAALASIPGVGLVLCGRQGSDFDQGTVPAALAEYMDFAFVGMATAMELTGAGIQVARVTPLGNETVVAPLPAVVTVSNEFGTPRYPTSRGMMAGRQAVPRRFAASALEAGTVHPIVLRKLRVAQVEGRCEFIPGEGAKAKAAKLFERLRIEGVLQ